jgi:cytochrome c biogenesis protein CcmG, thiol:disulfide interchange protein DsbE
MRVGRGAKHRPILLLRQLRVPAHVGCAKFNLPGNQHVTIMDAKNAPAAPAFAVLLKYWSPHMSGIKVDHALKAAIIVLLGVLVVVIYTGIHERIIDMGDQAPGFDITADNGRVMSPSHFGGRLLVLNFWATWCAPCVQEVPSLNQFAKSMAGSGVVVLGVSVDTDPKTYRAFLARQNVSFLTARDPSADLPSSYGTYKYPETYIIDSTGKVVWKAVGAVNWTDDSVINSVRALL